MKSTLAIRLLLQSLSHSLRTPLSVVSNDIQYFEKIAPNLEAGKTLRATQATVSILKEAEELSRDFTEAVLSSNFGKIFKLTCNILCDKYGWQEEIQNTDILQLTISCQEPLEVPIDLDIAALYVNVFKKEGLEIFLIDSACKDLGINQKIEIDQNTIKYKLSRNV